MTSSFYRFALLLAWLSGCSWLVSPEEGPIKCSVDGGIKDRCPKGTACVDGECQAQAACRGGGREVCADDIDNDCDGETDEFSPENEEICNERKDDDCDGQHDEGFEDVTETCDDKDNDCDGKTDEGYDLDNDGWTKCGRATYKPMTFDCDVDNPNVFPGNKEVCDGLDNDCDGEPPDNEPAGKSSCGTTQVCDKGRCVAPSCAIAGSPLACPAGERCIDDVCVKENCPAPCATNKFCDLATRTCVDVPAQKKNGDSCTLDAECESKTCFDSAALYLPATPRRVCGQACCSDGDCEMGQSCFASGTGARSCLPTAKAVNRETLTGADARTCSKSGSPDCLSGEPICAANEGFQLPSGRRLATTTCRRTTPNSSGAFSSLTAEAAACASRLRLQLVISSLCTQPCRSSTECTGLSSPFGPIYPYCQYVELSQHAPGPAALYANNYAPICLASLDPLPAARQGASCKLNSDCRDGTCIVAAGSKEGKCAPPCCNDAQCTAVRPESRCLPVARGTGRFEMRCIEP